MKVNKLINVVVMHLYDTASAPVLRFKLQHKLVSFTTMF